MQENDILREVTDNLLDNPDILTLIVEPRNKWEELLIKFKLRPATREYKLRGLRPGNAYRISKAALAIQSDIVTLQDRSMKDMLSLVVNHMETVVYVAAIALKNPRHEPTKEYLDHLMYGEEFTHQQLQAIAVHSINKMNLTNFTNTIVLVRGSDILSQTSPVENEETIARSASLEAL